jgi:hypothetical protein
VLSWNGKLKELAENNNYFIFCKFVLALILKYRYKHFSNLFYVSAFFA